MSEQPSFPLPANAEAEETTGRLVITFTDQRLTEGLAALKKNVGVSKLPSVADTSDGSLDMEQVEAAGGAVFPTLGIAVVTADDEMHDRLMALQADGESIAEVEPERVFYAIGDGTLPLQYLHGYRDAVNHLCDRASQQGAPEELEPAASFSDDANSTWGLKATRALSSRWTGRGINVAVLDTGMDLQHPDFRNRSFVSKSFVSGVPVQDLHGHGTHCIGTACGFRDGNGRQYGIGRESTIYVGKVLGNDGRGTTAGILAGIEWAIVNRCAVISMSLGNIIETPSAAYTAVGRRAIENGSLIVAAAGNHRGSDPANPRRVGQPANSPFILAVGAVDSQMQLAPFSCRSGPSPGANVDIVAPGVRVYSSYKMTQRYAVLNGTSMATPHVAGIAAQYAQAFRARGAHLYQLLVSRAQRLPLDGRDCGAGLVQAPV